MCGRQLFSCFFYIHFSHFSYFSYFLFIYIFHIFHLLIFLHMFFHIFQSFSWLQGLQMMDNVAGHSDCSSPAFHADPGLRKCQERCGGRKWKKKPTIAFQPTRNFPLLHWMLHPAHQVDQRPGTMAMGSNVSSAPATCNTQKDFWAHTVPHEGGGANSADESFLKNPQALCFPCESQDAQWPLCRMLYHPRRTTLDYSETPHL